MFFFNSTGRYEEADVGRHRRKAASGHHSIQHGH